MVIQALPGENFKFYGNQVKSVEQSVLKDMSNIERAYEQMSLFMGIVDVINSWFPRGVKECINLQIEVFNNLKGTMNICKTHSKKILELLSAIESDWDRATKNPNSWWNQREDAINEK